MPDERTILSLTLRLTQEEVQGLDHDGKEAPETYYTLYSGEQIVGSIIASPENDEYGARLISRQIEHLLEHLEDRILEAATRTMNESFFVAGNNSSRITSTDWQRLGREFFNKRNRLDEERERELLRIRRGRKQLLTQAELAGLPNRFDTIHLRLKAVKKRHDIEKGMFDNPAKNTDLEHSNWMEHWLAYAKTSYCDVPHPALRQIASLDAIKSRPSEIAYGMLAAETLYDVSYLRKLVSKERNRDTKPAK